MSAVRILHDKHRELDAALAAELAAERRFARWQDGEFLLGQATLVVLALDASNIVSWTPFVVILSGILAFAWFVLRAWLWSRLARAVNRARERVRATVRAQGRAYMAALVELANDSGFDLVPRGAA